MSGFILHALKSVARANGDFAVARPNVRADPQCSVALWTHAGWGHVPAQNWYSHIALCGEKTFQREVPDSVEWGNCLVNMEISVEKLYFFGSDMEVFFQLAPLSPTPLPPTRTKKRTHWNKPEQTLWMTFLKNMFDCIVPPSRSWLCLTPASFALSEKVKH